jgi:predicted phage terminase large subunit-like protein
MKKPAEELAAIEAELGKRSLKQFVHAAWPILEPEVPLCWNWHLDVLCQLLEDVTYGKRERLIINVPPGTMKSLLVNVLWPAWTWTHTPEKRFMSAAYQRELSQRDTLKMRDVITHPWYTKHYGLELRSDQAVKTWFINAKAGWRIGTSTTGKATGEHPDIIIIDDPHKADDAKSELKRETVNNWFSQTVSTRGVTRGVAIVIIMQRLHEEDMSGKLLDAGSDWEHVMFPMRYEAERADKRDPRTKEGELLWPTLFPEKIVKRMETELGQYGTAGQLQQRPAPLEGGLFKRGWFKKVDAPPAHAIRCRGWDTAATEDDGDYTVGVKISVADGIFYVEDVERGQWGPSTVEQVMQDTTQADGIEVRQREEKEPGSAGVTVIASRAKLLVGYDYAGVPLTGDKETRARPFRAQAEAGNVRLVRGEWNEAYLQELCVFPNGSHDDQVDGSSCAFNELTTGAGVIQQVDVAWG